MQAGRPECQTFLSKWEDYLDASDVSRDMSKETWISFMADPDSGLVPIIRFNNNNQLPASPDQIVALMNNLFSKAGVGEVLTPQEGTFVFNLLSRLLQKYQEQIPGDTGINCDSLAIISSTAPEQMRAALEPYQIAVADDSNSDASSDDSDSDEESEEEKPKKGKRQVAAPPALITPFGGGGGGGFGTPVAPSVNPFGGGGGGFPPPGTAAPSVPFVGGATGEPAVNPFGGGGFRPAGTGAPSVNPFGGAATGQPSTPGHQ